ncbi:glycosyltransferase [Shewanella algicola]|uniref:glycosyltransferase n=1 Tax=Shewanella algicola TaxID=640633 RepID=UPI002494350C|nr:glycosyltransferase [Shewanella algicola]
MKVAVNATSLRVGGALTILNQFVFNAALNKKYIFYIFVDHDFVPENRYDNIIFIALKKRTWLSRIVWDFYGFDKYLKINNLKVSKVVSLQNTSINTEIDQVVYLHQPLPFTSHRFSFFTDSKMFCYQRFYSFFIFLFYRENTKTVVQTNWMKDKFIEMKPGKFITVIKPSINLPNVDKTIRPCNHLIYPASPLNYKNHRVILQAMSKLKKEGNLYDLQFNVTLSPGESSSFDNLVEENNLKNHVIYLGKLSYDQMIQEYQKSIALVFPSYIETFGLPLAEAASLNMKIIASDENFARDVLKGYKNVTFAKYNDVTQWCHLISKAMNTTSEGKTSDFSYKSNWNDFFQLLE